MSLPETSCLKCQHAKSVDGLMGFAQCEFNPIGCYRSVHFECDKGQFCLAANVEQRLAWWARRQNQFQAA